MRLDSHIVFWVDPLHFAHNGLHLAVLSVERHCKIKASNRILVYVCVCIRVESYTSENSDLWRKVENLETANR